MSEEVKVKEWKEANRDRQVRMNEIQEKARQVIVLSVMIKNLKTTFDRINSGEGFFKAMPEQQHGVGWEAFPGIDEMYDEKEIRRLIANYVYQKMQKAEAEFDKL